MFKQSLKIFNVIISTLSKFDYHKNGGHDAHKPTTMLFKGTHSIYLSSSLYITTNQKPMIHTVLACFFATSLDFLFILNEGFKIREIP